MTVKPWRMMADGVIKLDLCTDAQLKLIDERAKRGPLSDQMMARRRSVLQRKLSKGPRTSGEARAVSDPRFFEVPSILGKEAALVEMRARWARDKAHAARMRDEAAEFGASFVTWPIAFERRWPKPAAVWVRHGQWFAMWRRSRQALQAEARLSAQQAKRSRKGREAPKMKRSASTSSCGSHGSRWEVLSECSDSSWQAVSEASDASWLDLATEADITAHVDALLAEVARVKEECQKDLDEALPALHAATDALNCLRKCDITEVKAMKAPPPAVLLVSKALCWCFGIAPKKVNGHGGKIENYWEPAKSRLWGDFNLMHKLSSYDKDNIAPSVVQKLLPLLDDPGFDPENVKKASCAAYKLCVWMRALIAYDRVAKEISPKREALQEAERALEMARSKLAEKQGDPMQEATMEELEAGPQAVELPALDVALECLRKLKLGHLQEIKAFAKPPAGVKLTMEAVCVMFGIAPITKRDPNRQGSYIHDYWKASQKLLADPVAMLARMFKLTDETLVGTIETMAAIGPYVRMPAFDPDVIKKASLACEAMCLWVRAMYKHHLSKALVAEPKVTTQEQTLGQHKATAEEMCSFLCASLLLSRLRSERGLAGLQEGHM